MHIQGGRAVDRIHQGQHAIQRKGAQDAWLRHKGLQHRRRVGEACDLHDDTGNLLTIRHAARQAFQGLDEVAAHSAAQAAGIQQNRFIIQSFDQQMIQADLAELVDQHGGIAHLGQSQQAVQQRGFASPEKAGEHGDGNPAGHHFGCTP